MKKNSILYGALAIIIVALGLWQLSKAKTFQVFGNIIASVPREDRVVALTFDDGPSLKYTDEVLSVLRQNAVKATFFVTGHEVEANLEQARRIVAAGHELGNHSYSHSRLIFKTPMTIRQEVERTDAAIRNAGFKGEIYFRPPYGKKLLVLPWYLYRTNRTTIMWSLEPESQPKIASSAQTMADHVVETIKPGSIVLLHLMYESRAESRKALPIIISRLRQQGYRFLSVSELLNPVEE